MRVAERTDVAARSERTHDRLNVVLLLRCSRAACISSSRVRISARLFAELDKAQSEERALDTDSERLKTEQRTQATPLARRADRARPAGDARRLAGGDAVRRAAGASASAPAATRSRMSVTRRRPPRSARQRERAQLQLLDQPAARRADAAVALEAPRGARRPRLRAPARPRGLRADRSTTPFFQKQGEIRYGRTIELPASRGRIVDRNGLIARDEHAGDVDLGDPEGPRRRRPRSRAEARRRCST